MSEAAGAAYSDPLSGRDDVVAAFQIESKPVRGRIVRLGAAVDEVLSAHDYPAPVAALLGEAVMLSVLVGSSLKFDGRLKVQAQGDGPVSLLLADFITGGGVRGMARVEAKRLSEVGEAADARALLGEGRLALSIDRGPDFDIYQSISPIEGSQLSQIAEAYFERSEQVPTRIALAMASYGEGEAKVWRGGGAIVQRIASDDARGDEDDDDDAWDTARALFETLSPEELVHPDLSAGAVLYRLFHEQGVRLFAGEPIERWCECSYEKVRSVMASFPADELRAMAEPDDALSITCDYCGTKFRVPLDALIPRGS